MSNSTDSTIYSLTSALALTRSSNPTTTTQGYTNNFEVDTILYASSPGYNTSIFLANLSSTALSGMAQLAAAAIAVGGQPTLHYQVVQQGRTPIAVITSFSYNGKTINA